MAKPYKGYPSQYAYRKARGDKSASGTPGATRARRAKGLEPTPPPRPRRGQWSQPTPGGTRDLRTRGEKTLLKAIRQAQREGREVLISVRADTIEYGRYDRPRREGDPYAHTGRLDPEDVLGEIEAAGGDVEAGIKAVLEAGGTSVEGVREYRIKELGA